jgi:DNA repair ATPase RecN
LVAVSFIKAAQHLRDALPDYLLRQKMQMEGGAPQPATPEPIRNFVAYAKAMNEAQEALNLAHSRGDVSKIDAAIHNLEAAPQLDATADDLRKQLTGFLVRARTIETEISDADKKLEAKNAMTTEFLEWIKAYRSWLRTSGQNYGLAEGTGNQSP